MSDYKIYRNYLTKSVYHIFKNLLQDAGIESVYDNPTSSSLLRISVDMRGSIKGEILFHYPRNTIKNVFHAMNGANAPKRISKETLVDVASELSNMITGTFVNQMQFVDHNIDVSPPELQEDDEEYIRTLYENVNLSFRGQMGTFDIDFYYREN